MKVFVLLMCTIASAAASNAVAWPGAIPLAAHVKTIVPAQINGFGYSTSQYINAIPQTIAHQPQFGYQFAFPGYNPYQPFVSASYFPSNSFLYPSFAPVVPGAPGISAQPPQAIPSPSTEQPAGDEDTAIIDSADFSPSQQQPSGDTLQSQPPQPPQPPQNSLDSKNMPAFPQIPQFPAQIPSSPQLPSLPQFPLPGSDNPNLPQFPQLPSSPFFPQSPSLPPSFPSGDNTDQGLNDEDTVSVDAA